MVRPDGGQCRQLVARQSHDDITQPQLAIQQPPIELQFRCTVRTFGYGGDLTGIGKFCEPYREASNVVETIHP